MSVESCRKRLRPQSFVMETAIAVRSAMFGHAAMEPNSGFGGTGDTVFGDIQPAGFEMSRVIRYCSKMSTIEIDVQSSNPP